MSLVGAIDTVYTVLVLVIIARLVIDWVQVFARSWRPTGIIAALCEVVYSLTDPPLRAIRKVLPPVRLGGASIDFAPMVLLIGLWILHAVLISIVA